MAAPASTGTGIHLVVISPETTVFDGQAEAVVVPAYDGEIGILRGHAPLMAIIGRGEMRVTTGGSVQRFQLNGGFVQVVDDVVTVLSEKAEQAG